MVCHIYINNNINIIIDVSTYGVTFGKSGNLTGNARMLLNVSRRFAPLNGVVANYIWFEQENWDRKENKTCDHFIDENAQGPPIDGG
jgi:hypothetical protein